MEAEHRDVFEEPLKEKEEQLVQEDTLKLEAKEGTTLMMRQTFLQVPHTQKPLSDRDIAAIAYRTHLTSSRSCKSFRTVREEGKSQGIDRQMAFNPIRRLVEAKAF